MMGRCRVKDADTVMGHYRVEDAGKEDVVMERCRVEDANDVGEKAWRGAVKGRR